MSFPGDEFFCFFSCVSFSSSSTNIVVRMLGTCQDTIFFSLIFYSTCCIVPHILIKTSAAVSGVCAVCSFHWLCCRQIPKLEVKM